MSGNDRSQSKLDSIKFVKFESLKFYTSIIFTNPRRFLMSEKVFRRKGQRRVSCVIILE